MADNLIEGVPGRLPRSWKCAWPGSACRAASTSAVFLPGRRQQSPRLVQLSSPRSQAASPTSLILRSWPGLGSDDTALPSPAGHLLAAVGPARG